MRLGNIAVQLGFLVATYALGVASGRQEAVRSAPAAERVPVAGSASEVAPALATPPALAVAQPERASGVARPSTSNPRWSDMAARAQSWTVAVRADQSYGAGVAVDRAGFVLTNLHVVDGAKSITVTPFGADPISAEVLDSDRELDLALLKLPAPLANAAVVGRSEALGVGDEVMAVGSPRKMYFSVSRGMVSFPNRFLDGVEYIQTDLPINVGNSGGPLVNDEGNVVGIVSFILRDSQGISFALPIDRAVARFGEHLTVGSARAGSTGAVGQAAPAASPRAERSTAPARAAVAR
ncbi:MAG TPA: trypsin-like peptidase domain-containing protein [Polyangiaceae bacterium]|nr:trypsin-like peptidase domain-containing protein [Polyangiaceae bacterium]